jgi:hypothetical protein
LRGIDGVKGIQSLKPSFDPPPSATGQTTGQMPQIGQSESLLRRPSGLISEAAKGDRETTHKILNNPSPVACLFVCNYRVNDRSAAVDFR